jgi:DNA-binding transcriptional MerR regulator
MTDTAHVARFTIGQLAKQAGAKVQTVRYYEQIGLLPPAARSAGNQRIYGAADAARLGFIRHARNLGFTIEQVRDLLALSDQPDRPCEEVDAVARAHLAEVERRMTALAGLQAELNRLIAACGHGGTVADCKIIEALGGGGSCRKPNKYHN